MTSFSREPASVLAGRAFLLQVRERADEDLPTYGEFAQSSYQPTTRCG